MKPIFKFKHYNNFLPILSLILVIILCLNIVILLEKKKGMEDINFKLLQASKNIKYVLGNDFIKSNIDENTYSKESIVKKGTLLNQMAKKFEVDYLYILVKKNDDIHYAIISEELEELQKDSKAYYWQSLKDTKDDSFDLTRMAFDSKKPIFFDSNDIWGSYHSVYVRESSNDGTTYIAGADIKTSFLKNHILSHTFMLFVNTVIIFLFSIPFLFSFRKLKSEYVLLKNNCKKKDSFDSLTGAYNRKEGLKILNSLAEPGTVPISVCLIDIESLGRINEKRGLQSGDDIIKIVVSILKYSFRHTDKVVRLEGDKFMVILPDCSSDAKEIIIKKLLKKLSMFNKLNKKNYFIKLHVLYVQYKDENVESFINNSLNRLILNKKNQPVEDLIIQEEILSGITNNEFKTFFQPKIFSKEKKIEFEALVRWFHPEKGMIPPNKFIPIAEDSFLIYRITELVLRDSLEAAKRLNTRISINISSVIFENETLINDIRNILMDYESRNLITFEITERTAMINSSSTLKIMEILTNLGVEFSIDDFGTGYSSLSYIGKFPISELKIDRSFINDLEINKINPLIINFSLKIGELAGFKVIAEGVETKEQIEKLISLGCYNFQGYYFDKAQPLDAILEDYSKYKYLDKMDFYTLEKL
ncbi:bifunctional diguanylate cyclase/phosphodiesterase [uncultured Ilyobacter sp.]|uniref:bifunctional diguanylate cyclase/phosphodiesterase n=1 Tax=uncultured Ilyobacter sp. TaxID=544433 RepID=UPI0029C7B97B|nr:bifunctional diguanylate cyclase/phosphodiesterase [uncultured Ilyobacter sp.]